VSSRPKTNRRAILPYLSAGHLIVFVWVVSTLKDLLSVSEADLSLSLE
jgi:hypothetical protein